MLLAIDTATSVESIALVDPAGSPLVERLVDRPRGHGRDLLGAIDRALADAGATLSDLTGLVCGLGPGSFTSLRISLATLKGLALATGLPLAGVPTWRALTSSRPEQRVLAVIDGRRGEVFAAGLCDPICVAPEALAERLEGVEVPDVLLGSGALLYREVLAAAWPAAEIPAAIALHRPRAALLAIHLGAHGPPRPWEALEPLYVRRSDAEIHYPKGFPDAWSCHTNRQGAGESG